MSNQRLSFTSERLSDGRVFVAGGRVNGKSTKTAELLDAGASGWSGADVMQAPRGFHDSALLAGDRVLVAGGVGNSGDAALASAEIWNPASGSFTSTSPMGAGRQSFALVALPNGQALAAGGSSSLSSGAGRNTSELYSPASNSWRASGSMSSGRLGHTATLLSNCYVLIHGDNRRSELYNYKAGKFVPTGSQAFQRSYHTATLLPSGRVLLAGGVDRANNPLASASLYNPATGQFSSAGKMSVPRTQAAATRLADGRVLVAGGFTSTKPLKETARADVYDPAKNSWSPAPNLPVAADSAQAQTLADGRAVVIGGDYASVRETQVFSPVNGPVAAPPPLDCSQLPGSESRSGPGLAAAGKGRVRANGNVKVSVSVKKAATVVGKGLIVARLKAGKKASLPGVAAKRRKLKIKLKPARAKLGGGARKVLKLRPKGGKKKRRKQARKLKRALKSGARAKAKIKIVATDGAGNRDAKALSLKVRR